MVGQRTWGGDVVGTRRFLLAALAVALTACTPAPQLVDSPVSSPAQRPVDTGEVVVGVGTLAGGYNPHKIADQSAITTALSNLLLPSVFRPGADGTARLDTTVMRSADVTSYAPYTVTYEIRADASWSDAAPVAAEDFVYLWEQVTGAAGTIDAAGYRLIDDINAREAGKVVEVVFGQPYPGWRTLFSGLLPAHLLKDAPGGWTGALQSNFPATAGPFAIKTLDTDRGEVVLERNDRYWEDPATLDRIILRRSEQSGLVDALDAGHDQLLLTTTDAVGTEALAALGLTAQTVARPSVTTLAVRPDRVVDLRVRQAVLALLDREQLITVGTGNGPAATLPADAQVLAPASPGYEPTAPTTQPDPERAAQLLTEAGYAKIAGTWTRAGQPLTLTIAAAEERDPSLRIATEVANQLTATGISTEVVTPPGLELVDQLYTTTQDSFDLAILSRPAGGDQATVLATDYGCVMDGSEPPVPVPANPFGICEPGMQPTMDAALTGALSTADALSSIEPALWQAAVSMPLFQEAETLVVRPEMVGVSVGPPAAGPFANAARWQRSPG
jgi:ABC-type transport system substrate-binding protein